MDRRSALRSCARGARLLEPGRALALSVGAVAVVLLVSCAPDIGVSVEQRLAIDPDVVTSVDTRVTTPPLTIPPAASSTVPPATHSSEPIGTEVEQQVVDPRVASLLLMDGDVVGWSVEGPQTIGPNGYGPSDCAAVDVLRSVDDRSKTATSGASNRTRFHNFLIEMDSVDAATAILDAADAASRDCAQFQDGSGPSTVQFLSVPSATGWRSAGVIFGGATNGATIAYWQRDSTIVKLRLIGTTGLATLGDTLAAKLSAFSTGTTVSSPIATEPWQQDPLATSVLEAGELPGAWTRTAVDFIEPTTQRSEGPCGIGQPAQPGGLVARFELADGSASLEQRLVRATVDVAQQWVTALHDIARCNDPALGATNEVEMPEASIINADELVGVRFDQSGALVPSRAITVGARFGEVFVMLAWGSTPGSGASAAMPSVDEMIDLLALTMPS